MNLNIFNESNLFKATTDLFAQLDIKLNSNTGQSFDAKTILKDFYKDREPFINIMQVNFVGIIDNSIFEHSLFNGYSLEEATQQANKTYEGLMLFALELSKHPNRTEISELTRAFNRISQKMPVALLIKYENIISFALSERFLYKQEWRQGEKVGKIIILRDINTEHPHSGHLRILQDLAKRNATNYDELHKAWLEVFNIKDLNNDFYKRLVKWYELCFNDISIDLTAASRILNKKIDDELKPQAVIRVIIRLMFIWFMKEKKLIKPDFFTKKFANDFLKNKDSYYNAVLQNVFFAVLNAKISERRFRSKNENNKYDTEGNEYGMFQFFRYESFFKQGKAEEFKQLTDTIPFINGGLFTCHDYKVKRSQSENYIIDGFSDNPYNRAKISDSVIFELIDLFNDYVFTIEESTPMEQDIALDPELLGTIFENLIGFYNPETRENARKQTGSFYTPSEIVDYMCSKSLKESLKTRFPDLHPQIEQLINNNEDYLNFPNKNKMLAAITDLKILDPACGSGAFPMGMFNLMVRTVEKLQEHKTTYKNKLDIIENCIYGIDIQNIAVEISKLRFFISLLVHYETPENIEDFEVLPNLETKFVVANTLIGIEKKKAGEQLSMFDLDKEFQDLTKIFLPFTTAKTPLEKEQIKNAFNKRKDEIINNPDFELGTDAKEKIRAWNPFNVCYCSPFFDSQIMFGIKEGFDVVIGNPPYVSIEGMSLEDRNLYKSLFIFFYHRYDLFGCFVEQGIKFLKNNGILCFIQPSVFLNSKSFMKIREYIVKNCSLKNLNLLKDGIFDSAVVPTMIICLSNNKIENNKIKCSQGKLKNFYEIKQVAFEMTEANVFNLDLDDDAADFIKKTSENTILLGVIARISNAINVGSHEKFVVQGAEYKENDNYVKLLKGGSIHKWYFEFKGFYLKKSFEEFVSCGDKEVLKKPKLMMKRIGKYPDVCYDESGIAAVHTVHTIRILNDNFSPKYILGLLNSKLIGYIFRLRVPLKGDVFPEFRVFDLNKQIPIKNISLLEQQPIISLVNQILSAKKENPSADTFELEKQIDALVYGLYGLTEEEIRVIDPDFLGENDYKTIKI